MSTVLGFSRLCPMKAMHMCTDNRCQHRCMAEPPTQRPGNVTYPQWTPPPKGCVCPPTSEQTCQRKDCGRKDPS